MSVPSSRHEQRRLTRRRIADAARRCFYDRGVAETSIDQIAREAGVVRATLYLHFANKDAILLELLASNLRGVRMIFQDLCELGTVEGQTLRGWLVGYIDQLGRHREAMRLFHVGLANDVAARGMIDEHRDAVAGMLAARYPTLGLADPAMRARIILTLARVDHLASAAAEDAPPFDVGLGLDLVAEELFRLLSGQPT